MNGTLYKSGRVLAAALIAWPVAAGAATGVTSPSMSVAAILGGATPTVKAVILILLLVSVATWTILVRKLVELGRLFRSTRSARERLELAASLDKVMEIQDFGVIKFLDAAWREMDRSAAIIAEGQGDGVKERVALMFERITDDITREVGRGVGLFATAASVGPFVGLFGTVWGIMHSFVGIAQANNTSLAVVAPGIAEALLATAVGLGVAIPATVMYNMVGKAIGEYRARLTDCAVAIMCLVSRDMEAARLPRSAVPRRALAEA